MKILSLHPEDPTDYCCNMYWVLADGHLPGGLNTLVDVGSSRLGTLTYLLRRMEGHPKGIGRRPVEQVVLTHHHYDHSGGLAQVLECFNPVVCAFQSGPGVVHRLQDGSWIRMGDKDFRVLHTPGHSEDSICLYCPENGILFSGDTLYRISDATGSYPACYVQSLERLQALRLQTIYPGHGDPITQDIEGFLRESLTHVRASVAAIP